MFSLIESAHEARRESKEPLSSGVRATPCFKAFAGTSFFFSLACFALGFLTDSPSILLRIPVEVSCKLRDPTRDPSTGQGTPTSDTFQERHAGGLRRCNPSYEASVDDGVGAKTKQNETEKKRNEENGQLHDRIWGIPVERRVFPLHRR